MAACITLLATLDSSYDDAAQRTARALAKQMCDKGEMLACLTLARYAESGTGGDIDQALQRATLINACNAGGYSACPRASSMASGGDGGPQDVALANALATTGCDGGNSVSCQTVAEMLISEGWAATNEEETEAKWQAARVAYARACELGDNYSCTAWADLLIEGRGGPADQETGRKLLADACASDFYQCQSQLKAEGLEN